MPFAQKKDDFASMVMEHLRLNVAYWGLTTLDILGKLDAVDQEKVVSWIMQCQDESGLYSLTRIYGIQSVSLLTKYACINLE